MNETTTDSNPNEPSETSKRFWEDHYQRTIRPWSGIPNETLAAVAKTMPVGRAMDLGCADGGDAVWLALQGWQVTGVDVSATTLDRAGALAVERGVADRVRFERHDLAARMPDGPFDLISASFFQSPVEFPRPRVFHTAAERLAPDGKLLIIDHASTAPWSWNQDPAHRFPTPAETYAEIGLDPGRWRAELLEARDREGTGPGGQTATVTDNIILIRRIEGI